MGGYGSGRPGCKGKVEHCRSLDVNRLHREGCLAPGHSGGWQWSQDGQPVASISMQCTGQALALDFRFRRGGGKWQDIRQTIALVSTPCGFGGTRPWFVCPGIANGTPCGRRVAKLHAGGRYFLCRHCYRLGYASQCEREFDRLLRRANKLRRKLGGEVGTSALIARRPKGMHRKTYDAHVDEIVRLEDRANQLFIAAHAHRWPGISLFL